MSYASHQFTLRQLQYAVAVAETLSFSRAAERCRVSQPSLSAQIAQLEDALGVQLFERDRRRVLVTPAGRQLTDDAKVILSGADSLKRSAALKDPLSATLRIGVIPTVSAYLLPQVAPAMRSTFPELKTVWREDKTSVLVTELERGALDLALLAKEADIGNLEFVELAKDPFLLATPVSYRSAGTGPSASLDELEGREVLLLDDGHCFREQVLSVCAGTPTIEPEFRATSLSTLVQMVAAGLGITLLPLLAVRTESQRGDLLIRPFEEPVPSRTLVLAWRRLSPMAEAFKKLADTLREAYPRDDCWTKE